jgi:hypothetical protein
MLGARRRNQRGHPLALGWIEQKAVTISHVCWLVSLAGFHAPARFHLTAGSHILLAVSQFPGPGLPCEPSGWDGTGRTSSQVDARSTPVLTERTGLKRLDFMNRLRVSSMSLVCHEPGMYRSKHTIPVRQDICSARGLLDRAAAVKPTQWIDQSRRNGSDTVGNCLCVWPVL